MPSQLSDRLSAARRSYFVGREKERTLFRSALEASEPAFFVLHVYGPGGIGKTSLLREFLHICKGLQVPVYYLDSRNVEPLAESFSEALKAIMGLSGGTTFVEHIASMKAHLVLLIDTYETMAPLDDWMRESFLPQLAENCLVVLAGRRPPAPGWRADPGWQSLLHVLPLRNLHPDESRDYLSRRKIPAEQHKNALSFTHGHPLALSLIADTFAQRGVLKLEPEATRDVVTALVEGFLQKVPGPAHRGALEACSLIRVTTESVLSQMLDMPEVHDLFTWLGGLSFIEPRPGGLFPHDLAREALVADLRWRNPDWYANLHRRARAYYTHRIGLTSGVEQQRALFDLVYLHRENPVIQPFFAWQAGGSLMPSALQEEDIPFLLEMVKHFEGETSAQHAAGWFASQPEGVLVLRNADGQPAGFLVTVDLVRASPNERERDLAIQKAWKLLDRIAPLRPGERATLFRFWMDAEAYQSVSPVQSLIFIHIVRHYLTTPGLAFTFFPCADPEFWAPMCAYANLLPTPEADFEVGGHRYAVFTHDWRAESPTAWLEILAEREMSTSEEMPAGPRSVHTELVVLSKPDFGNAVWDVLRGLKRPEKLAENPLLRSRLVAQEAGTTDNDAQRILALQHLIGKATEELKETRRGVKFYRALYHTYLQPASTQEQAAELLNLPYSTYRRHLKTGIERVTEVLWRQEVGGKIM